MADVVFVLILLGFVALGALYVRACDGIVRSGEAMEPAAEPAAEVAVEPAVEVAR
jgi:hypothetical protein